MSVRKQTQTKQTDYGVLPTIQRNAKPQSVDEYGALGENYHPPQQGQPYQSSSAYMAIPEGFGNQIKGGGSVIITSRPGAQIVDDHTNTSAYMAIPEGFGNQIKNGGGSVIINSNPRQGAPVAESDYAVIPEHLKQHLQIGNAHNNNNHSSAVTHTSSHHIANSPHGSSEYAQIPETLGGPPPPSIYGQASAKYVTPVPAQRVPTQQQQQQQPLYEQETNYISIPEGGINGTTTNNQLYNKPPPPASTYHNQQHQVDSAYAIIPGALQNNNNQQQQPQQPHSQDEYIKINPNQLQNMSPARVNKGNGSTQQIDDYIVIGEKTPMGYSSQTSSQGSNHSSVSDYVVVEQTIPARRGTPNAYPMDPPAASVEYGSMPPAEELLRSTQVPQRNPFPPVQAPRPNPLLPASQTPNPLLPASQTQQQQQQQHNYGSQSEYATPSQVNQSQSHGLQAQPQFQRVMQPQPQHGRLSPGGAALPRTSSSPKPISSLLNAQPSPPQQRTASPSKQRSSQNQQQILQQIQSTLQQPPQQLQQSQQPFPQQNRPVSTSSATPIARTSSAPPKQNDQFTNNGRPKSMSFSMDPNWFYGNISRIDTESILQQANERVFLVRESNVKGNYALSKYDPYLKSPDPAVSVNRFGHLLVDSTPYWHVKDSKDPNHYSSIQELLSKTVVLVGFRPLGHVLPNTIGYHQ